MQAQHHRQAFQLPVVVELIVQNPTVVQRAESETGPLVKDRLALTEAKALRLQSATAISESSDQ